MDGVLKIREHHGYDREREALHEVLEGDEEEPVEWCDTAVLIDSSCLRAAGRSAERAF